MKVLTCLLMCFQLTLLYGSDENAKSAESLFSMGFHLSEVELNPLYTFTAPDGQVYTAIHEGLVSYDPQSLNSVPAIAERWEILAEGKLYRFYINPQAYYSNGDKILSTHFKDAWLKMLELGDESPFGFLLNPVVNATRYRLGEIDDALEVGITTPEDDILEIRLEYPVSYFLSVLTHQSLVVIHPDGLNVRDWNQFVSPPSSGPYYIATKTQDKIELLHNENYWDKQHSKFDRINLIFSDDGVKMAERFNSGELQWIYSGVNYSDIEVPDSLQISPQFSTSYYFFSMNPPFDDEKIRRALIMLLPLNDIRSEEVYFFPSSVLIPQFPGYPKVSGIQETDKASARLLLEESGYPNGNGLPPIKFLLHNGSEIKRISEIMRESWEEELNVSVELSYYDFHNYHNILRKEPFSIGFFSWIGDYADPMTFFQLWSSDASLNLSGYADPTFETILNESNKLIGYDRYKTLAKAEDYLLKSAVIFPINHSPSVNVIDLELIGGWYPNPLDIHPFKHLYIRNLAPPRNIARLE